MLVSYLGAAALALQCAHAFKDASPFFLYSTDPLDTTRLADAQVARASNVESNVAAVLNDCDSHSYVFVSQAGVSSADFAARQSMPHLERRLDAAKTAVKISNLVGEVDGKSWGKAIAGHCGQKEVKLVSGHGIELGMIPQIEQELQEIRVDFAAPPVNKEERASTLARYDSYLNDLLVQLDSYTVVYTTTPPSAKDYQDIQHPDNVYEMDSPFPAGMHGDLKRDLTVQAASNSSSGNLNYDLPLFEKYQFVNQGIFITGSVTLLLLLILSVGVSAIANLEVSYMAFSKEMGPAAQKKQQ
ncbi:BIG/ATPase V1 complex, subunit S1 [Delphinella strobiligena]|nr:BIG/ATPase V1 complex, subunit S1 [Delphinella strobiligena]